MEYLSHHTSLVFTVLHLGWSLGETTTEKPSNRPAHASFPQGEKITIPLTHKSSLEIDEAHSPFVQHIIDGRPLVDKSDFIGRVVEYPEDRIALFRPRQCSKTMNLDMVREFLRFDRNNTNLFLKAKLKIMDEVFKSFREKFMNRYPVIYLDFAEIADTPTLKSAQKRFHQTIKSACAQFDHLMKSEKVTKSYKKFMNAFTESSDFDDSKDIYAIENLCVMIFEHYGIGPFIIIDNADSPVADATLSGFLDEMEGIVTAFYLQTVKHNDALKKLIFAGVTPMNAINTAGNIYTFDIYDSTFKWDFGFSEAEVNKLLSLSNRQSDAVLRNNLKKYYSHFRVHDLEVYNPASVIKCCQNNWNVSYYASAHNSLQRLTVHLLTKTGLLAPLNFETLICRNEKTIHKEVVCWVFFENLLKFDRNVWSFFIHSGILVTSGKMMHEENYNVSLTIPGLDIQHMLTEVLEDCFKNNSLPKYTLLADYVESGKRDDAVNMMSTFINKGGVYLFGEGPPGDKDQVEKMSDYVELMMSDWMHRYGKNVTKVVERKTLILRFYKKDDTEEMKIGIRKYKGVWGRIRKVFTLKTVLSYVNNVIVWVEFHMTA